MKITHRVSLKISVILTLWFFDTSNDSIRKDICNAIMNMKATRQFAIIFAFLAL
jgi:hypothetical protein